jgi:hypothetical protein
MSVLMRARVMPRHTFEFRRGIMAFVGTLFWLLRCPLFTNLLAINAHDIYEFTFPVSIGGKDPEVPILAEFVGPEL